MCAVSKNIIVKLIFCGLLLMILSIRAQHVVDKIYIGFGYPTNLAYNVTNNKIYIGAESGRGVIVLDGETNEIITMIPTVCPIKELCWSSVSNKIYVAHSNPTANYQLTTIDCEADTVVSTIQIPLGGYPELGYNPINDKIYCTDFFETQIRRCDLII